MTNLIRSKFFQRWIEPIFEFLVLAVFLSCLLWAPYLIAWLSP